MKKSVEHLFSTGALAAVIILLSLPALNYGYLLEDYKWLRSYDLPEIARTFWSYWEPSSSETKGYRPLHSVHYALFHFLIGGAPRENHLLQVALLLLAVGLFYQMMFRATRDIRTAFWSALIYPCLSTTAWQVSRLTDRAHLLLVIFILSALTSYDRFLCRRSRAGWGLALFFSLLALLLKEDAVTLPFIILAWTMIVRGEKIRAALKPLLPFFLLLGAFLLVRAAVVSKQPKEIPQPPALPTSITQITYEYSRSLFSTLVQTQGIRDPNHDFPLDESGVVTPRDYAGLLAAAIFSLIAGALLLKGGSRERKKICLFGVALVLIASVMVAAWYRTNRLFIGSLGVAILGGSLAAEVFSRLRGGEDYRQKFLAGAALLAFLVLLAINLHTFFIIQASFRPDTKLVLIWDKWVYEEYIPWMKPEQIEIFRQKLFETGRTDWALSFPRKKQ